MQKKKKATSSVHSKFGQTQRAAQAADRAVERSGKALAKCKANHAKATTRLKVADRANEKAYRAARNAS